jgi:hypothetical protein
LSYLETQSDEKSKCNGVDQARKREWKKRGRERSPLPFPWKKLKRKFREAKGKGREGKKIEGSGKREGVIQKKVQIFF